MSARVVGGDRLASVPALPPPAPRPPAGALHGAVDSEVDLRPIVDQELGRLLRWGVDMRVGFAPLLVLVAAVVIWVDPDPWRRVMVGVLATLAMVGALVTARRVHRAGFGRASVPLNFAAMAVFQALMILATGGIESPAVPVMVPLCMLSAMLLGRGGATLAILALQEVCVLGTVIGQSRGWLPELRLAVFQRTGASTTAELWTAGVLLMGVLAVSAGFGILVRTAFEHMVRRALDARNEQLRNWVAHTRDLEALSGEIAHELKNPLASIKGLAALLVRDVPEGRASSRLGVMRTEVDRMQGIIEEFLTFSRPLSPLSLDTVEPAPLCQRVADLYDGVSRARGVAVEVSGRGAALRGDHRKLLQILVNLVQNAVDAAPSGSLVELTVRESGDGVVVEVADRGPGLPAALGNRVFEPGVSGKPNGSGLGLTIALALARQHGGDLSLLDRPGGGTIARLWLPIVGPVPSLAVPAAS